MPNSREPGFTPVFRNPQFKDKLSTTPDPSLKSYRDVIVQSFSKKFPNCKAAGNLKCNKRKNYYKKINHHWSISVG